MNLRERINQDLKDAMKSGDKTRLTVVRSIRALILEFEKSGNSKELTAEEELKMLSTAAKKRKDSIDQFKNAGRNDLVENEEAELKILMTYLPKQLNENEIRIIVSKLASEIGAKTKDEFPKLMPLVMKELKGKADGKLVKSIVENILAIN
jgi:uncharacterized protein YqeY